MIAALLTAAALVAAGSTQETVPARSSLLRAAPEGTLMAVACDDVQGFIAGLRASPFGALWGDASLLPLRAKLDEAVAQVQAEELYPGGPPAGELIAGLRGAALFLGAFGDEGPAIGAVAVRVDDQLAPKLAQALAHAAAQAESVELDGLQFQVHRNDGGEWVVTAEWLEGLVVAFGKEREQALDWGRTVVEALAADPRTPTTRGRGIAANPMGWPALELHVHVGDLFRSAAAVADAQDQQVLAELGLLELPWAWAALTAMPRGGLALHTTANLACKGWIGTWIPKVLSRPAPVALGDWAPADAVDVSFLALDTAAAFDAVADLAARTGMVQTGEGRPPAAEVLRQRLDEFGTVSGVELREALIENLTGDFARFVLPTNSAYAHAPGAPLAAVDALLSYTSGVLPQVGSVHVVGLHDGSGMEDLIEDLIALAGADSMRIEEQVGDHWMQSLEIPGLPLEGIRPSWVVLDDALLLSGGPSSLRAVLAQLEQDAAPSWLEDTSNAASARALLAPAASGLSIADSAALFERRVLQPLRELDAALEDETYGGMLQGWLASVSSTQAEEEAEDPLDKVRGYLRLGIAVGERLRDGALRGSWMTKLSCVDSFLVYRTWTEPANRD